MYKNPVHLALVSLGLLEKAILGCMWVSFTFDFVDIFKTKQKGHILGGLK